MLVLSRKRGEKFIVETSQGTITIHVLAMQSFHGSQRVKLGIDAPKSMPVHRIEEPRDQGAGNA